MVYTSETRYMVHRYLASPMGGRGIAALSMPALFGLGRSQPPQWLQPEAGEAPFKLLLPVECGSDVISKVRHQLPVRY